MDGIAKNMVVQIEDHYVPTDFLVVDMGEECDRSSTLPRPSYTLEQGIIYIGTRDPRKTVPHHY
jgi:hypothetical protein